MSKGWPKRGRGREVGAPFSHRLFTPNLSHISTGCKQEASSKKANDDEADDDDDDDQRASSTGGLGQLICILAQAWTGALDLDDGSQSGSG